ncbi:universal stress protein [Natronorubrum sulfidifaciens]|uniref:UspA domain-containing protein n=1 Tax=Natronorubrum sulfidifaciens JCM 14089 TaxID=1230460 RepID=L9W8H2_9EURY|nr:universal stress protein [Natronorubrum sulfidifaciens]ELY44618.1 UspA domain-containing protein [Natronorubrum sulfidifaciens JCM 14089]
MSRSILVAHDGSSHAQAALEYALEMFPDTRLVVFHAIDPFELTPDEDRLPPLTEDWLAEQHDEAATLFADALEAVDTEGVVIETETAVGSPAQTIVAAVEETGVDGIVIGSRGRGNVAEARMGSTAELVVKRASVPVTVVR